VVQGATDSTPCALDAKAVASALQIGTIDATPSPAYAASLLQHEHLAPKHAGTSKSDPLPGWDLSSRTKAWNALSPEDSGQGAPRRRRSFEHRRSSWTIPAKDAGAVGEMRSAADRLQMAQKELTELLRAVDKLVTSMRADMVPAEMFDAAKAPRATRAVNRCAQLAVRAENLLAALGHRRPHGCCRSSTIFLRQRLSRRYSRPRRSS
jgi:hypothetical protein